MRERIDRGRRGTPRCGMGARGEQGLRNQWRKPCSPRADEGSPRKTRVKLTIARCDHDPANNSRSDPHTLPDFKLRATFLTETPAVWGSA